MLGVRREFQFPSDLWLPRRENRCRQPPNNHTSYDYHTPGVYTRARGVSSSLLRLISLPLVCIRVSSLCVRLSLSLPIFFISTRLITNSQAYLAPLRLRKIAWDLSYCTLLVSLSLSLSLALSFFLPSLSRARLELLFVISLGRDSNYLVKCEFLFIGRTYIGFRSP